jgi:hypothetical protein
MSRPGLLLRWCVPDLAFATACVTLFYCLFLFQGYQKLFRDSDAGWHIRTGEAILTSGNLPRTDPYSFTRGGQPWFAWEWMADVAVGAIHRTFGLKGVAVFYAAAISAGVWLWFRLHWALGGNFLVACAMAPLLLSTCNIHWLARPHVLSWIFLLLAIFPRKPNLIVVALVTALWANVHASFFFAPLIALLFALEDRWYLKAAAVAAVAPLLNPYGPQLYVHVFRYLTDTGLLARIGEFQSFDFHSTGAAQIVATVILGVIGGTLALTQKRLHHFALAILITAGALRSARALPLCALLLLPIANAAIIRWLRNPVTNPVTDGTFSGFFSGGRKPGTDGTFSSFFSNNVSNFRSVPGFPNNAENVPSVPGFLTYSDNLRALDSRFQGLALVPLVLLAAFCLTRTAGFPSGEFPVAAYPHIPAGARLFAPDKFGGYLIYRSNGTLKVFFDGRSDLYGADFLKQYSRLVQVRPGWRAYWESFHFTHALLPADAPLLPALEQIGWRPLYQDKTATLLVFGGT